MGGLARSRWRRAERSSPLRANAKVQRATPDRRCKKERIRKSNAFTAVLECEDDRHRAPCSGLDVVGQHVSIVEERHNLLEVLEIGDHFPVSDSPSSRMI